MNHQENVSVEALKAKADVLAASLGKNGIQVKRTQALETVAQMYGYPNWSTARAAASKPLKSKKPEASDGLQDFAVEVVRIGYATTQFYINATSEAKAAAQALEEADLVEFSEHTSEYFIEGKEEEEEPEPTFDVTEGPEKQYCVYVCRKSCASRTLTIRAANRDEAEEKALDTAGDYYFSGSSRTFVPGLAESV